MASRSLGTLTLSMVVRLGGFTEGMAQAERETEGFEKALAKMAREGAKLTNSLLTPFENLTKKITAYQRLLAHDQIKPEFFDRAVKRATEEYNRGLPAVKAHNAAMKEGERLKKTLLTTQEKLNASIARYNELAQKVNVPGPQPRGAGGRFASNVQQPITNQERDALTAQAKEKFATSIGASLTQLATPTERLTARMKELNDALKATSIGQEQFNRAEKEALQIFAATDEATIAQNKALEEGRRLVESMLSPQKRLNDLLAHYNDLVQKKALTQTQATALGGLARERTATELGLGAPKPSPMQQRDTTIQTANQAVKDRIISQERANAVIKEAGRIYQQTSAYEQANLRLKAEGRALTDSVRTAQERYNDTLRRYDGLLKLNKISEETHNRLVRQARTELNANSVSMKRLLTTSIGLRGSFAALAAGLGIRELVQARVQFESVQATFKAIAGTDLGGQQQFKYAADLAKDLGLNLESTTGSYSRFLATSKEAGFSVGETQGIFTRFASATRVLGLSAADQEGVFRALTQMMNKTKVTSEELRNQLAERLPGAIPLLAKSMNVSTETLSKMLEKGEVLAYKVLPDFAKEVERAFGGGLEDAKNSLGARLERMNTAVKNLEISFLGLISGPLTWLIDHAAQIAQGLAILTGNSLDPGDAAELQIRAIESELERLNTFKVQKYSLLDIIASKATQDEIKRLSAELKVLQSQQRIRLQLPRTPEEIKAVKTQQDLLAAKSPPKRADDADKDAENARQSILKQVQALEQQRAVLDESATATIAYRIAFGDLKDEFDKAGPGFARYKQILIDATQALEQATAVKYIDEQIIALQDQAATLNLTEDAVFEYNLAHGDMAKKLKEAGTEQARLTKEWRKAHQELRKAQDTKTIIDGMIEVEQKLLEIMGRTGEAAKLETQKQYKDLREALQRRIAEGSQTAASALTKLGKGVDVPVRVDSTGMDHLVDQADKLSQGINIPVTVGNTRSLDLPKAKVEITLAKDVQEKLKAAAEKARGVFTVKLDGRFYNIPKEINGVRVKLEEAVANAQRLMAVGVKYPSFQTKAQAYEHTPLPYIEARKAIKAETAATSELAQTLTVATGQAAALNQELSKTVDTGEWELTVNASGFESWERTGKRIRDEAETPIKLTVTADTSEAIKALEDFRKNVKDPAGFPIDLSRPRLTTADGDVMTEFTTTENIEGRWYNLPQVVKGALVDVETAIEDAKRRIAAGDPFTIPGFDTLEEAEKQAVLRSEAIDAAIQVEKTLEERAAGIERQSASVQVAAGHAASSLDVLGTSVKDVDAALAASYLKELDDFIQLDAFTKQANDLSEQFDKIRDDFGRDEQTLDIRVATGNISQIGARKKLIDIHQKEAAALQEIVDKYKLITDQSDIPELEAQLLKFQAEIEDLKTTTDEFGKVLADAFETNLADSLEGLASGVLSLGEAATQFIQGINEELLRTASENIASIIRDKVFDKGGLFGQVLGSIGVESPTFGSGPQGGGAIGLAASGAQATAAGATAATALTTAGTVAATALTTAGTTSATALTTSGTTTATALSTSLSTTATALTTALSTASAAMATAITTAGAAAAAAITAAGAAGGVAGTVGSIGSVAARGIGPFGATGGLIEGPGTGTSDSILAHVSRHEYIVPAKIVAQPGVYRFLEGMRRGAQINLPKFAQGGLVRDAVRGAPAPILRPSFSAPLRVVKEHEETVLPIPSVHRVSITNAPAPIVMRHERASAPAVRVSLTDAPTRVVIRHERALPPAVRVPSVRDSRIERTLVKDHSSLISKSIFRDALNPLLDGTAAGTGDSARYPAAVRASSFPVLHPLPDELAADTGDSVRYPAAVRASKELTRISESLKASKEATQATHTDRYVASEVLNTLARYTTLEKEKLPRFAIGGLLGGGSGLVGGIPMGSILRLTGQQMGGGSPIQQMFQRVFQSFDRGIIDKDQVIALIPQFKEYRKLLDRRAEGGALDVRSGGLLRGPGTSTSDSMLLLGSTKEFMVRAQAVQQPGALSFLNAFNRGHVSMDQIRAGLEVNFPEVRSYSSETLKNISSLISRDRSSQSLKALVSFISRDSKAVSDSRVVRDHSRTLKDLASFISRDRSSDFRVVDHSRTLEKAVSDSSQVVKASSQVVKDSRTLESLVSRDSKVVKDSSQVVKDHSQTLKSLVSRDRSSDSRVVDHSRALEKAVSDSFHVVKASSQVVSDSRTLESLVSRDSKVVKVYSQNLKSLVSRDRSRDHSRTLKDLASFVSRDRSSTIGDSSQVVKDHSRTLKNFTSALLPAGHAHEAPAGLSQVVNNLVSRDSSKAVNDSVVKSLVSQNSSRVVRDHSRTLKDLASLVSRDHSAVSDSQVVKSLVSRDHSRTLKELDSFVSRDHSAVSDSRINDSSQVVRDHSRALESLVSRDSSKIISHSRTLKELASSRDRDHVLKDSHSVIHRAEGGALDVRRGGVLQGAGTTTSDSLLLLGSTKEFMVRAKAVQQPGALAFLHAFNRGRISMDQIQVNVPKATDRFVKDLSSSFVTLDSRDHVLKNLSSLVRDSQIDRSKELSSLQVVRDHSEATKDVSSLKDRSSSVVKEHSRTLRELASLVARSHSSQIVRDHSSLEGRSSWFVDSSKTHSTSKDRERERVMQEITSYIPVDQVQRSLQSFYEKDTSRTFATAQAQVVGKNGPELVYGGPSGTMILPIEKLYAGRYATGGMIPPNKFGLVGEGGREVAMDSRLMQIARNSRSGDGPTVNNINVNVDAPSGTVTRPTAEQLASTVARRLSASARKSR